jgi:tetratricopeptide (TPR) repeat protein
MGRKAAKRRQSAAHTEAPRARGRRPLWICLALTALNLFIYSPVRSFEFVNWDDPSYITENAMVMKGLSGETFHWAITTARSPYWHPVTWLTHLLDVRLFGLDAGWHHVTNLIFHAINTLLIFGLFRTMTGDEWRSAFIAAVFGVHPLHVESVAWVTERKDVLSTFFWALTVWAYTAYVRAPTLRGYLPVVAFFGLAVMSKPMVVTLPAVLLLFDIWPLRRVSLTAFDRQSWTRALLDKIPLLAITIGTSIATVVIQRDVGAMAGLDALPLPVRIANAIMGYLSYIWMTVWPAGLAAFYPIKQYPGWLVALAAVSLVAVTIAVVLARSKPYLLVGWFFYLVTLSPVIGLLQAGEQRMADRFMYVPMFGLLIVVAWGVPELMKRLDARRVLAPVAVAIVIALAVTARAQTLHWASSITLWEHAARVTPESYIAHENLGQALRERGRLDEAAASYRRALNYAPGNSPHYLAVIHNSLGIVATRQGNTEVALHHFREAVRFNENFAEPRNNLANALAGAGRPAEALEHYRAAVRLEPELTEPRVGLGSALLTLGQTEEAVTQYQEALRIDAMLAQAHNGLGAALARQGRTDEAIARYHEALRLDPNLPTAHLNMAVVLIKQGKAADAKAHLERALAADPSYAPARQLLARLGGQEDGRDQEN